MDKEGAYAEFLDSLANNKFEIGLVSLKSDNKKYIMQENKNKEMELDPFDFIMPTKLLEVDAKNNTCHNCGETKDIHPCKSGAWTSKYWCQNCGFLNYIIFSDRMGGATTDTVMLFEIHPKTIATKL